MFELVKHDLFFICYLKYYFEWIDKWPSIHIYILIFKCQMEHDSNEFQFDI